MPKVTVTHYYGDYVDYIRRRNLTMCSDIPQNTPLAPHSYSRDEIKCKNDASARRVLTRELNRDRLSPAYSYDRPISHQRPNMNDRVHVTVSRWEGSTHSTVYVVECDD